METIGTWWIWAGFGVFVPVAIAVDLLVMEKQGAHGATASEPASSLPTRPKQCIFLIKGIHPC